MRPMCTALPTQNATGRRLPGAHAISAASLLPVPLLTVLATACTPAPPVVLTTPHPTTPCDAAACVPDPPGDEVRHGWANVAVDPEGGAWMLYARADERDIVGLYLARSPAPGAPLDAPIAVAVAEPPNVGSTEKPSIAVDGDRIAIAYTGLGPQRHGDARALYVQIGTWDAETGQVAFDPAQIVDRVVGGEAAAAASDAERVLEQARVAIAPSGEIWALWKRQIYGTEDRVYWAREDEGFAPREVSAQLSREHDCSPPDFRFGGSGRPLVGLRSNVGGWLQTVAVVGAPSIDGGDDGIEALVQVSDDQWPYNDLFCPTDGPRLEELADGTLFAAWMAPSGDAWRLFSSWSIDAGRTWTPPGFDHDGVEGGETWVAVAATADGPFHTSVEGLDRRTRVLTRSAPGEVGTERWLTGGTGSPLSEVEIASRGARSVAVGMDEDRVLWLTDL